MAIPGANPHTIADLVPGVIDALQQRTDIASIAPRYIAKALLEITESNPFEELRRIGPTTNFVVGQPLYSATQFVQPGDDLTMVEVWTIFVDFPTNNVKDVMDYKTPKAMEMMTSPTTKGLSKYWTRFGTNFKVGPVPDKGYTTFMQYQVRHPLPPDATALSSAQLYIPPSWEDIVEYAAAERIAIVKRWNDQVDRIHTILYGDPEFQTSQGKMGRPGLISARLFQVERDQLFNTRQLGIRQPRYNVR